MVPSPAAPLPHDLVLPLGWGTPETSYNASQVVGIGDPYSLSRDEVFALLRQHALIADDNLTDPHRNILQSETGEITIDAPRDILTLDTPCTAGGFAPEGETIRTRHGLTASVVEAPATVWVSALDEETIAQSCLLVTHLTDLQNNQIEYGERTRQTLQDWGSLPHLVRTGQAIVRLRMADPGAFHVWAVSTGGARVAPVPAHVEDGELVFTADVGIAPNDGAILCYEIAR